jgi:hypothetical protein
MKLVNTRCMLMTPVEKLNVLEIVDHLCTYSLVLRPSESLGPLNYGRPFFPFECLLLPSLNLHLPQILLDIFHASQSWSSPYAFLQFILIYLTVLPRSFLTACPIHSNHFLLISATMHRSSYSFLNS